MPLDASPPTYRERTRREPIHPTYLPFSQEELAGHFADVRSGGDLQAQLEHFVASGERTERHAPEHAERMARTRPAMCSALDHQIEKDERFWVATALMTAFYAEDRTGSLARLLEAALGPRGLPEDFAHWADALGPARALRLFFEANLPAPDTYKRELSEEACSSRPHRLMLPYSRSVAQQSKPLEGATKVDAILVAPSTGFAVVFEAKVLADTSSHTTYDAIRNQIARNLDVLLDPHPTLLPPLDARQPERTCFVLLTPQIFLDHPHTRLYGSLMRAYMSGGPALHHDLPHRDPGNLARLSTRLGWTSWERLDEVVPGACPWLTPTST